VILADLFKKSSALEIANVVYLILGSLAPAYEGKVFNIADKMMLRAIAQASGAEIEFVKKLYKKRGDIGVVAEILSPRLSRGSPPIRRASRMTVNEVHEALYSMAIDEGEGSQERKIDSIVDLLRKSDKLSNRFIARIPVGKLRLGFSDKTVIDALSFMVAGDKSAKKEIEAAYQVLPDVGSLAAEVKQKGIEGLGKRVSPKVGVPVMPMLAQRLKSPDEMIKKMGEVAVEPKFDGLRALVHYKKDERVRVFTRNLNEVGEMFPEIQNMGKFVNARELILDSEAVGLDPKTERMVDFQKTIQRRRKHNVESAAADIPLRFQVFDILMKDGENYMGKDYLERRRELERVIKKNSLLVVDEKVVTSDPEVIRRKHEELLGEGLEGVIVKKVDSTYVPGRTGWRWVKMKEVEEAHGKLADTIDAVVMGYTQGKGKRAEFGIGQFLVGVPSGGSASWRMLTISKVGTGLSDEQFRGLAKRLKKIEVKDMPENYEVTKDLTPDFWVKPEVVVELAADEITVSPANKHTAGYALRFPRLIKFRDDKSVKQATTLRELKDLFKLQKH
jgi:DNA ligase-1